MSFSSFGRKLDEIPRIDIIRCNDNLKMEENDILLFPVTVPGFESSLIVQLVNPTGFYYKYSIAIHEIDENETDENGNDVVVSPQNGAICPYGSVELKWAFRPNAIGPYTQTWKIEFRIQLGRIDPKERLPHFEFKVQVEGVGESCQVEAHPTMLDFGLVELFNKETLTFKLNNLGNAVLHLFFYALHEQQLQGYPSDQIAIEPSSITIPAQGAADIGVTIRPSLMTTERYGIYYSMQSDFQESDEGHLLCSLQYTGHHPILQIGDINQPSLHPICDGSFAWSMFSIDKLNKILECDAQYLAQEGEQKTPPKVTFNFPSAPIGSESAIFTLLLVNKGTLKTSWEIYREPPKTLPQEESHACFNGDNPTDQNFLSSLWSIRGVKNPKFGSDIDKESPFHREKNSRSARTVRDVVRFKVLPTSDHLDSSESVQISFRYVYKSVGFHEMYFLLTVNPALFVWIHVKGRTLEVEKPFLQHFYDKEVNLIPVALAEVDPAIQLIWLYNGGTIPAEFQIQPEPCKASENKNDDSSAFELVSSEGVILPRSWGPIKIRFRPNEIKEYNHVLNVIYENGAIALEVRGTPLIDRTTPISPMESGLTFPERYSLLMDPMVPVRITPTRITIKHCIPTGQEHTSVLFLTNLSQRSAVSFGWPRETEVNDGGSISFRPSEGILRPNEKLSCQLILRAGNASIMSTTLIRCNFIDIAEEELSRNHLDRWETCKTFLLCNGVTETEANTRLFTNFGKRPQNYEPCSKVISVTFVVSSALGNLDNDQICDQEPQNLSTGKASIGDDGDGVHNQSDLTLPPFAQLLSRDVVRNVLWDIVQSESFENFTKMQMQGDWKAPVFRENLASETQKLKDWKEKSEIVSEKFRTKKTTEVPIQMPVPSTFEILTEVLFNLIEELNVRFEL